MRSETSDCWTEYSSFILRTERNPLGYILKTLVATMFAIVFVFYRRDPYANPETFIDPWRSILWHTYGEELSFTISMLDACLSFFRTWLISIEQLKPLTNPIEHGYRLTKNQSLCWVLVLPLPLRWFLWYLNPRRPSSGCHCIRPHSECSQREITCSAETVNLWLDSYLSCNNAIAT